MRGPIVSEATWERTSNSDFYTDECEICGNEITPETDHLVRLGPLDANTQVHELLNVVCLECVEGIREAATSGFPNILPKQFIGSRQ